MSEPKQSARSAATRGAGRALIDERDIASVAVRALTEDGHTGARYVLSGPEVLTQADLASSS